MTSTPRVRMDPDSRREQLLELGTRLFATRTIEEFSIDLLAEAAGISRGLLYHYFGNKRDFQEAVVRRSVDELIELTGPTDDPDLPTRLRKSLVAYLSYVEENHRSYVSIVQAAWSGNETMREIYVSAKHALADRIFDSATAEELAGYGLADTPGTRLFVRGWATLVEDVVLSWVDDPAGVSRDALIDSLVVALATLGPAAPRS